MSSNKLQVAVIGGGVCGLTCAIALQQLGVSVQLFEAAAAFGEIGAGIGLGPNVVRVLEDLGLLDELLSKIGPSELRERSMQFIMGQKNHEVFYTYETAAGNKTVTLHRAAFLSALVGLVEPSATHFNKRCTAITESPTDPKRLVVHFRDGTTYEADVVLGADGVRSTVRSHMLGGDDKRLAFSNTVVYRGLIPYAKLKAAGFKADIGSDPACLCGPSKHIILVSIKNKELVNFAAFSARYDVPVGGAGGGSAPAGTPWVEEVSKEEMIKEYEGWSSDVSALLACMPEKTSRWSVHVVSPPLESYAKGHIALLGDAAHAMLPHLGAGAGQGIEDVYVLAKLLGHPDTNLGNVEAVLDAYSRVRQPRAQMVWDASYHAGSIYDLQGETISPEGLQNDLQTLWDPVWHSNLDDDLKRAVISLCENGSFSP